MATDPRCRGFESLLARLFLIYVWLRACSSVDRARGYGPRCRGFESLLARSLQLKRKRPKNYEMFWPFFMVLFAEGVDIFFSTQGKFEGMTQVFAG